MCRLFGLHGGRTAVDASFWLLDAPDSLESQSHRNPDGFGIGAWSTPTRAQAPGSQTRPGSESAQAPALAPEAASASASEPVSASAQAQAQAQAPEPEPEPASAPEPEPVQGSASASVSASASAPRGPFAVIEKAPRPAWADTDFATDAHRLTGTTFVAHVRHASTGALTLPNTHPFEQAGRLFAHNGALGDLPTLEARLRDLDALRLVHGDTDSERYFALLTASIAGRAGDVEAGVSDAVSWIVEHLPVVSLNFVMTTATDLWALRYPETDTLYVLERPAGGESGGALRVTGSQMGAGSPTLADHPSVVVASEPLDGEPAWRALASGEIVHVGPDLVVSSSRLPAA